MKINRIGMDALTKLALSILFVKYSVGLDWFSSSENVCGTNDSYVDCRHKNLTQIPRFPDLPMTVTQLDFSFNKIKTVSMIDVPFPSSVVEISFLHNAIDTITKGVFSNMTKLYSLDLSYNKITGSILNNEPLFLEVGTARKLSLRGNNIGTIKDNTFSLFGISNLQYLDLSHCSLRSMGQSMHNLGSLTFLNLSYNLFTSFTDDLSGDLGLETLDLSYNKISKIRDMPPLLSLKYLYLDYNGMNSIPKGAFASLLGLEGLSLKGNNLRTLQPKMLPLDLNFNELVELKLDKNPWRCDCNMKWLLKDFDDDSIFRNFTLICNFPSRLRGKNIFQVTSKELTCPAQYSRLIYTLILFFASCFMVAAIGYLIYFKRKILPCFNKKGGNYIAVYTNEVDAGEGASVHITTADDESLVNNEEKTTPKRTVQYFDV